MPRVLGEVYGVIWNSNFVISTKVCRKNFISLYVRDDRDACWCLILFYGNPIVAERNKVWEDFLEYIASLSYPYLVVGDYNQLLTRTEK